MYPVLPSDILTGGWELICYGFTLIAAVCSYLFFMR
jgi:hypothetical protein